MKEQIISAFNELSEVYEFSVDRGSLYNTELERPAMMDLLPRNLKGFKVFDAGCAAGWYTDQFLQRGATVVSCDISPEMIQATIRRVGNKADVRLLDLTSSLPFPDHSFDYIVSSLTLHYLKDWEFTFSEFQRVLKRNGVVLFSVHHPFMDIHLSKTGKYFMTEGIIDEWNKNGLKVQVPFYRRPLERIINDTLKYFSIEELIEPQPTNIFQEKIPLKYKQLMSRPHFLIIKARNTKK